MTPQPSVVLRRGDSGPAVADVRDRLVRSGDLAPDAAQAGPDRATALFDERVETAVKSFQQRRGLLVDGIVGRATYAVLDGSRWALGDRVLRFIPEYFLEGDDVGQLQERLVQLGFRPGKVDGIFGPETEAAVCAFQTAVGLVPDGTVGPETMRAFAGLGRSITGGSANALREREHIRRSGHSLTGRTIVLDPGHGGGDAGAVAGAVAGGLTEADLALDVARRVEGRLSAHGVNVVFTRTELTDAGSDEDRAAFANSCGADLLLSLHCDHATNGPAHGVATFFYGHADRGADQGGWSTIGERFADLLLREVVARTGLTDCRTHPRTWALLRRTRMPAVRLDFGYLSHPLDAARLAEAHTRDRIAEGVVVALQRMYLGEADTTRTGVLRLDDLRRHLEEVRAAGHG
ncbi:MAG TPA: N-acetylmuramoyl-L-alanine amidase [Intrasporangium sp.]|uniref:N-acetylmuramoyl-L-alanine amidase n=1 Tax=Intrasporangium sp. TaxID=1925024 RepID=UPI002D7679A2|nr:N-acetylmuramoyl-L-alanine amidase [Intrasporangium sp.]HET7397500.1 N-acetylmuramoyl-L-alanine amidase [Intrasporangium sp.]